MTRIRKVLMAGAVNLVALGALTAHARIEQPPRVIKITAGKYHFTPDRISLLKGQPVTIELISNDVTHGFMLRALKIDTDIRAGKTTDIAVIPAVAGTFTAICDHYCGFGHGGMKMTVVVEEPAANAVSLRDGRAFGTASK